jgi:hypothetical protein
MAYPHLVTLGSKLRTEQPFSKEQLDPTQRQKLEHARTCIATWLYYERARVVNAVQQALHRICAPDYQMSPSSAQLHAIPLFRRTAVIEQTGGWSPSACLEYLLWLGHFPSGLDTDDMHAILTLVKAPVSILNGVDADDDKLEKVIQALTPELPRMASIVAPMATMAQLPVQTWAFEDRVLGVLYMTIELPI